MLETEDDATKEIHGMKFPSLFLVVIAALIGTPTHAEDGLKLERTASGKPNLNGSYDSGTLTPLNRPEAMGEKQFMTREEAAKIAADSAARRDKASQASDPDRGAPVLGGSGTRTGGGGGTGGYNNFWMDGGSDAFEIDGKFRTSIVYDPPNGRQPPMTEKGAAKRAANFTSFSYVNDGTPSWLDKEGRGPFDGPEDQAFAERCLLGFSAGPPMLPGPYNNFKRIVQTEDHIVIFMEMVHDARIIRLDSEHGPADDRRWLGDSVGHWEGDVLVVETTNFREETGLYGGDRNLHLVERFTQLGNGNLLYNFTVDDPTAWTAQWSGEFVWKRSTGKVYEYACHEGNYAMGNTLRGARLLEREELERRAVADSGD